MSELKCRFDNLNSSRHMSVEIVLLDYQAADLCTCCNLSQTVSCCQKRLH